MGNLLTSNPIFIDTAAVAWSTGVKSIRMIQWLDDAADIADGDTLAVIINDATISMVIQVTDNTANNAAFWTFGPFNPGIPVSYFEVVTLGHGVLSVVVD